MGEKGPFLKARFLITALLKGQAHTHTHISQIDKSALVNCFS